MNNIKTYANDLLEFFHQRHKLQNKPTIIFAQDKQNSMKPFGKTAHYDPADQCITVYTTGRHMKDCLRSLAHELVHHLQNERGDLMGMGATTPGYAQKDPHMRKMEKEAFLIGNMCFRDFEDRLKNPLDETNYKDKDTKGEQKMSYKNWRSKEFGEMLMDKWGYKPKEKSFLNEAQGTASLTNADYATGELQEAPEELDEEETEDALAEAHPMSTEAKEEVLEDLEESALRDAVRDMISEMLKSE